jgi:DNA excision repair protein ERCC-6
MRANSALRCSSGNRILEHVTLAGAPIQNRLSELWSLMDFVYPGRLGDLPVFEANFAQPIAAGAWSHATVLQAATAHQTAAVLKDVIEPYLLRRLKRDVNSHLPSKTEQVLFCRLAPSQRAAYARFLRSQAVADVLDAKTPAFAAITTLRRLCNHPGLSAVSDEGHRGSGLARAEPSLRRPRRPYDDDDEGGTDVSASVQQLISRLTPHELIAASGKLIVLVEVLASWHAHGHRCLIFCQGRQMLSVVQAVVASRGYSFLRMDGTTRVSDRQVLIDTFNADGGPFAFLLTTRVGGVGCNLVGADRVVLVDPDWNPRCATASATVRFPLFKEWDDVVGPVTLTRFNIYSCSPHLLCLLLLLL